MQTRPWRRVCRRLVGVKQRVNGAHHVPPSVRIFEDKSSRFRKQQLLKRAKIQSQCQGLPIYKTARLRRTDCLSFSSNYFEAFALRSAVFAAFFCFLLGIVPACCAASFFNVFSVRVDTRTFTPPKRTVCKLTFWRRRVAILEKLRELPKFARFPVSWSMRDIDVAVVYPKSRELARM